MEQRRSQSIVQDKSFRFAVQIVRYIRRQQKDHVNLVLTRQLLRSGTSIGANVEEALGGQSSKDFISKVAIAAKEARETGYGSFGKLSRTTIRSWPACWQNAASWSTC